MRKVSFAMAVFFSSASYANGVPVFGLPLGGKLEAAVPVCPADTSKQMKLCWVGKPYRAKDGSLLGSIRIEEKSLPLWAEYEIPRATISKDRILQYIEFPLSRRLYENKGKIVDSVSSRFGKPEAFDYKGTYSATWSNLPGVIKIGCINFQCHLDILSEAEYKSREETMKAREERDRSKPSTL